MTVGCQTSNLFYQSRFIMMTNQEYNYVADYYTNWNDERLADLQILPPYEPKDRVAQWVRGSIRQRYVDGMMRDFVVTGPKMKICFGGCNWNRIVFAMNGAADSTVYGFERWLRMLAGNIKSAIWTEPGKFKPGAVSGSRFIFDDDYIKPANNPVYPDELRCKLATRRETPPDEDGFVDVVDADLFVRNEDGSESPIDSKDIVAGSYMIPILKFSYYRNVERFGMTVTVIKGLVFPSDRRSNVVDNKEWQIDYDNMEM